MFVTNGGRKRFALETDILDGTAHIPPGCVGCGTSNLSTSQNQLVTYEGFKIIVDRDVFSPHPLPGLMGIVPGCCTNHITVADAESDQSTFSEEVRREVSQEELNNSYVASIPNPNIERWLNSFPNSSSQVGTGVRPGSLVKLWNHNNSREPAPQVIGSFLLKSYINNQTPMLLELQSGRLPNEEELARRGRGLMVISDESAYPSNTISAFTSRWLAGKTIRIISFQRASISDFGGTNNDGKITINGIIPVRLGDFSECGAIIKEGETTVL